VIAPGWVLSAAHCKVRAGNMAVIGAHNLREAEDPCVERIKVTAAFTHPGYDADSTDNDIMLLKLETDTKYAPVSLVGSSAEETLLEGLSGTKLTVSGWGTLESGGQLPDILQSVEINPVRFATCNGPRMYAGKLTENMMCAGVSAGGKDSCQGDSGGPLVARVGGEYVQVGVVSWGEGCADKHRPGVYTRLSVYSEWIKSVQNGEVQADIAGPASGDGGDYDYDDYDNYDDYDCGGPTEGEGGFDYVDWDGVEWDSDSIASSHVDFPDDWAQGELDLGHDGSVHVGNGDLGAAARTESPSQTKGVRRGAVFGAHAPSVRKHTGKNNAPRPGFATYRRYPTEPAASRAQAGRG